MTKVSDGEGSSGGCGSSGSWRKKKTSSVRPFKDFHADWIETLRSLLPLLRHSMLPSTGSAGSSSSSSSGGVVVSPIAGGVVVSPIAGHGIVVSPLAGGDIVVSPLAAGGIVSPLAGGGPISTQSAALLSTQSAALLSHFQAYYHALDLATPSQLFAPFDWLSPIEKPFLWLGDFHPSLFTNLLRSLDPTSQTLIPKIEQIERNIRLIAPSIFSRFRNVRAWFADRYAAEWAVTTGKEDLIENQLMEELESILRDANRLRRSVLGETVGAADVYQGAMFLEVLAEFVAGFWDEDLIQEVSRNMKKKESEDSTADVILSEESESKDTPKTREKRAHETEDEEEEDGDPKDKSAGKKLDNGEGKSKASEANDAMIYFRVYMKRFLRHSDLGKVTFNDMLNYLFAYGFGYGYVISNKAALRLMLQEEMAIILQAEADLSRDDE